MKLLLRIVTPWWLAVTGLTAEEAEPGTLTILQEKMAEVCQAVPGERLLLWEDDALQAAVLVGEQLGREPAELEEFLREFTGAAPATGESGEARRLERA